MRFTVTAVWDPEAEVWTSETDVPGLVVEADSLEEFFQFVADMAPMLIADDGAAHGQLEAQDEFPPDVGAGDGIRTHDT